VLKRVATALLATTIPILHRRADAFCRAEAVHKVSIIPRGVGALGYTIQRPIEDRFLMKGRAGEQDGGAARRPVAELIVFNHLSTGAADDLRRVTDIARSMVTRYGMSEKLGSIAYDREPGTFLAGADRPYSMPERDYADETAAVVDHEVHDIVERVFQRTQGILSARRAILDRAAKKLLEKETLEQRDPEALIRETPPEGLQAV
jgi:cell division protease FtsH